MKKYLCYLTLILFTSILFISCSSKTEDDNTIVPGVDKGTVDITVHVVDNTTNEDIGEAVVSIIGGPSGYEYSTNSVGKINVSFENDKSRDLVIITKKKGFYADTSKVSCSLEDELEVTVKLQKMSAGSDVTGPASAIILVSQSSQNIGVRETGSKETANILFEVRDSSGNAIDITNSALVNFRFGVHPGGGEYLGPTAEKTNGQGRVYVNLSSGTKAGVVEVIAEINPDGNKITKKIISKPVNISIHGGHPDQTHFTLAAKQYNFPGWVVMGILNPVTALVGDKWDNPAKPLTSVYFNTDAGIIEGSSLTNDKGFATVNLISGNPLPRNYPSNSIFNNYPYSKRSGYTFVRAFTANEYEQIVCDSIVVLFSGHPQIYIEPLSPSPAYDTIPCGSSQVFKLTVKDENGNPLSPGTKISVTIAGEAVGGGKEFDLDDYLFPGPGTTEFTFSILDLDNDAFTMKGLRGWEAIIKVTGPNGKMIASVNGLIL